MANRTVIVDNNTWNNTHIATVGRAMASPEAEAYEIARFLDTDYVLVIFGGYSAYSRDDISKFLWMVRIAAGVFPTVKESNYYNNGIYRVDHNASQTMLDSLMYRLSYYRFGEIRTTNGEPLGYDTARNCEIGKKGYDLEHFEEAYSTERWIVRIYRVLPLPQREKKMKSRYGDKSENHEDDAELEPFSTSSILNSMPSV